jgi:hypothetical protein
MRESITVAGGWISGAATAAAFGGPILPSACLWTRLLHRTSLCAVLSGVCFIFAIRALAPTCFTKLMKSFAAVSVTPRSRAWACGTLSLRAKTLAWFWNRAFTSISLFTEWQSLRVLQNHSHNMRWGTLRKLVYSTSCIYLWTIVCTWNIQTHNSIMHVVEDVIRDISRNIIAFWLTHVCYGRCHVWRSSDAIGNKLHNSEDGLLSCCAKMFWHVFFFGTNIIMLYTNLPFIRIW